MEKYSQNDVEMSILMSIHVNTVDWVNVNSRENVYQYIASVHPVLKGQQPNLVVIVQVIDTNQETKHIQSLTALDWKNCSSPTD